MITTSYNHKKFEQLKELNQNFYSNVFKNEIRNRLNEMIRIRKWLLNV